MYPESRERLQIGLEKELQRDTSSEGEPTDYIELLRKQ
jgi:hypothetical protein